jgi:mersacidin/lichenicidin family type 2 lantibiotic
MFTIDVARAWKDEDYRAALSAEQLAQVPRHPAGGIEVQQSDRNDFEAGRNTKTPKCTRMSHCF